jgi:hypothetical protein
MTTRQRYSHFLNGIRDSLIQHIEFVEELNDDKFREEIGVDWNKATYLRFIVSAETVNGVEEVGSFHIDFEP